MGLDITAYGRLEPAPNAPLHEDGEPKWNDFHVRIRTDYTKKEFPGRADPLPDDGVYGFFALCRFRAGSYSGYSEWRNELARMVGWESARAAWESEEKVGPFLELINFSDCDGVIGSSPAAKLAKDFAEWQDRADQHQPGGDDWFPRLYRDWRKAFEMAADAGAVIFH